MTPGIGKLAKASLAAVMTLALAGGIMASGLDSGFGLDTYRQLKRDLADYRLARSYHAKPCPASALVIAALGQSNAGNHIEGRVARDGDAQAYVFFRGSCYAIEDPLPGSSGPDGSLWTMLAQRLSRERQQPVVIVAGGLAGSTTADWTNPSSPFPARVKRRVHDAALNGLPIDVIVWLQGESDAEQGTPQEAYRARLTQIIDGITISVRDASRATPRWIIFRATRCGGDDTVSADIRAAQAELADEKVGIFAGPDTDVLAAPFRRDGCHFNAAGREAIIEQLTPLIGRIAPRTSQLRFAGNVLSS